MRLKPFLLFQFSNIHPGKTEDKEGCSIANEAKTPRLRRGWDAWHQEHCYEEVSNIEESNSSVKYSISQVRPRAILLDAAGGVHNPLLREGGQVLGSSCREAKLADQPKPEEEGLVGVSHYGGWFAPSRGEFSSVESFKQQNCQVMIYEEYEFEFMGVEDENETAGDFASGSSPTTNLVAGADGELGRGKAGTEKDYRDFTLCFPTIKFPGSYAFTVTMWNGISNLMYNSSWNLTNPVFHSENITLLLPGGEGYLHETGKDDDGYCIQFPNGTKILDENNKEKCYSGNSLEVVTP